MASVNNPTSGKCQVCGVSAKSRCSCCRAVVYCSKEHQRQDWAQHKPNCIIYTIKEDPNIGRYVAANLPLRSGELVIREKPVVVGPKNDNGLVCLGCHNRIELANCHRCRKCGWSLCSEACEASPHHKPECVWTQEKRRRKVGINGEIDLVCITILRTLYLSIESPDDWAKVCALESHCERRRVAGPFEFKWHNVANFLRNYMRLEEFSEEEIVRVCGIFQINAMEVPLSKTNHAGLFITSSMFEHSCFPNCCISFSDEGELLIWASAKVKKGEHISITYIDPVNHTYGRCFLMRLSKFFSCSCQRCSDPTEFGTNFSGLFCPYMSCSGIVLPETFLRLCLIWKCTICSRPMTMSDALAVFGEIDGIVDAIDQSRLESLLVVFRFLETIVPPNCGPLVNLKFSLAQMIGHADEGMGGLDMETLNLKEKLCRELLDLSYILFRSECRQIGILHYHLYVTLHEKASRLTFNLAASSGVMLFMEAGAHLEKCLFYLKYEPQAMTGGQLYKIALSEMEEINAIYNRLSISPLVAP